MPKILRSLTMISRLFPALNTVDGWFAGLLPFVFRLMIWGALGGTLSILMYARLSPQASIKGLKKKMRGLQREMLGLDLEFADFMRLSIENLKTSLRLFAAVLGPGSSQYCRFCFLHFGFTRVWRMMLLRRRTIL